MEFECQQCGKCCRADPKTNEDSFHIRIFDFEMKKIKDLIKEKNLDVKYEPAVYISDEKSKKNIVVFYQLMSKDCPFLEKNGCIIYEDRPLLCRAFPIITSGLDKVKEVVKSGLCEGEKIIKEKLKDTTLRDAVKVYGSNYYSCYLFEKICKKQSEIVKNLIKNKKIIPINQNPSFEFVDLADYFEQNNIDFHDNNIKDMLNLNTMDEFLKQII